VKVLENKKKLEEKKSTSFSPIRESKIKNKEKFYKPSKHSSFISGGSKQNLPPLKKVPHNFSVNSNNSSGIFDFSQAASKIPIRDLNKAIEGSASPEKKLSLPKKVNPKKELFNRLKLLDSIGKSNPESITGSIRKGFVRQVNKSIEPLRETPKPYESYLEQEDLHLKSFDTSSTSKFQK
jgi:hypothetical protein